VNSGGPKPAHRLGPAAKMPRSAHAGGARTLGAVSAPTGLHGGAVGGGGPQGTRSTARAIGGQGEGTGQGEEVVERTEWWHGMKWGWRQLIGTNPAVDGDLECSGLANQSRARRGEVVALSEADGRVRHGAATVEQREEKGGTVVAYPF
jgi:hypothetical protein